jgi:hypothetical protein
MFIVTVVAVEVLSRCRGGGVEVVEAVEHGEGGAVVEADQMTGARCPCAGRVQRRGRQWLSVGGGGGSEPLPQHLASISVTICLLVKDRTLPLD